MSSTSAPEPAPGLGASLLFGLWAAPILVLYVVLRPEDLQPVMAALASRGLDLFVPLALVGLHLAPASFLLRRLRPGVLDSPGFLLYSATLALGLMILVSVACGLVGGLRPLPLVIIPALLTVACAREWGILAGHASHFMEDVRATVGRGQALIACGLAGASLLLVLTPPVSQDALHYHLTVPAAWLEAGSFEDPPGNLYARLPMNVELLFLGGLAWRGEIAAKVFHWLLGILSAAAVIRLAGRNVSPRSAVWAGIIFLSIPTVFRVMTWAYVEMGMVLFLLTAWLAFLEMRPATPRAALLIGLFLGLAVGTKYTLLLPALIIATAVVVFSTAPALATATGMLGGVIGGGFWYFRNLIELGNPLFPFLYSTFGGKGWDPERARLFETSLAEWGPASWDLPWALTFDATFGSVSGFDGIIGPVFLIAAPLIVLALVRKPGTRTTAGLAGVLITGWLLTTHQIRFLVPTLAVLAALVPAGWESLEGIGRRAARDFCVAGLLLALVSPALLVCGAAPLAFALGVESEEKYLERTLPGGDYALFHQLPEVVPEDGKILFAASGNPVFLCERPYHADSVVENHTLRRLMAEGKDARGVAERFREEGFTHLLFRLSLVFGDRASDLTDPEKGLLLELLNRHGDLCLRVDESVLYAISAPEESP